MANHHTIDDEVFQSGPALLVASEDGKVWLRSSSKDGDSLHIKFAKHQPGPEWECVAHYVPETADFRQPDTTLLPCFVIGRFGIRRLHQRQAILHPGLICPKTLSSMHAIMQARAPELRNITHSRQQEQAGVLLWKQGQVVFQMYEGPSQMYAVEPRCGNQRGDAPLRPDETLLAEFHTHPSIPGLSIDVAPPSGPDLYQLALAAAKGEHNCLYVVSSEGTYVCRLMPSLCHRILPEMRSFLLHYGHNEREVEVALKKCVQPRVHLAHRVRNMVPRLWELLEAPTRVYRGLANHTGSRDARILHFCESMKPLGLCVTFLPSTET